jgi:hypothetical protein
LKKEGRDMSADILPVLQQPPGCIEIFIYYFIAFLCGYGAALAELLSRYSDGVKRIFQLKESNFYLVLNGAIALIAYAAIKQYSLSGYLENSPLSQAIVAGFSAMALLRSSIASIKLGQTTVQAGLAPILQVFLNTVDRAFDRKRSQMNIAEIKEIMKDVDFGKAVKSLPTTCLSLMQNVSHDEGAKMGADVLELENNAMEQEAKAIILGIIINKVTGPDLLRSAVNSLKNSISITVGLKGDTKHKLSANEQENRIKELKKKVLSVKSNITKEEKEHE